MNIIKDNISNAISRVEDWHNSHITIQAQELYKENDIEPENDAVIYVGQFEHAPFFSYFNHDGKIILDDIFEAGDYSEFPNANVQLDYFNLLREIQNPGSTSIGKVLTLYTARPIKDRSLYDGSGSIPSNIFLSSSLSFVKGLASDLGGSEKEIRDIYQVKIDSKYLVTTMNSPSQKQYQVIGNSTVPVKQIKIIEYGEKL